MGPLRQVSGTSALARSGVVSLLRLEVTEGAVMGDAARRLDVLQRLRDLGVRQSIELTIDRSFVLSMCTTQQDAVLVRTAKDLGHNLGLTVVAEGVEGEEHVDALRTLGCDVAPAFHFARPMPAAQLSKLLATVGTMHDVPVPAPR